MIALGEQRRFGQDGAAGGALEDHGASVGLEADQLHDALEHDEHVADRIVAKEQEGAGLDGTLRGGDAAQGFDQVMRHDRDHTIVTVFALVAGPCRTERSGE